VNEPEIGTPISGQTLPVFKCLLQKSERPLDIGPNEFTWSMNGTIYVALSCEVNDGGRLILLKSPSNCIRIFDVRSDKDMPWITINRLEVTQVPRIAKNVERDDIAWTTL
jgi:hypothetical protein